MLSNNLCPSEQIAAYLDGELDGSELKAFEQHVEACQSCRNELTAHRVLLCELDAAMSHDREVAAPGDFARIVAAHAETDMRGVRSRAEHKRALRFIVILALAAFSLLGASASDSLITSARVISRNVFALASFTWTTIYDTGGSIVVISRVLSRKVFIETGSLGLLVVFLALAVLLLSRLIASYHRGRAIE
jgi:anti-sigma factor RsiW